MDSIIGLPRKDLQDLVTETAARMSVHPAIVEKDIWVCVILERIFTDQRFGNRFVFKGGTSLSKVYRVIRRFSEDIDLILDQRLLGYNLSGGDEDFIMPSWTKQDRLNKEIDAKGVDFVINALMPCLDERLADIPSVRVALSDRDRHIIDIHYSSVTPTNYLSDAISLEIGPLAAWIPSSWKSINSYVSEHFENVVGQIGIPARATSAERTFWEKASILHQQAHGPSDAPPPLRPALLRSLDTCPKRCCHKCTCRHGVVIASY